MQKIPHPIFSFSLVIIQFGCILLLLISEPWFTSGIEVFLQIFAIFVGISAILTMHIGHFNIIPDPLPDIQLVTKGPYRWIRHPMYASILYFFLPVTLISDSWITWLIFIVLSINLLVKLHYEEWLLTQRFADYPTYQKHSKKLIPYLY